jgi:hypothetical protein
MVEDGQMQGGSFESQLGSKVFKSIQDKSYIDKLLGKKELEAIRILIKTDDMTRSELLELLYMLTSVELKLSNLNEYDRYLMGKYFTWVRDLVKLAEFLYDYEDQLNQGKLGFKNKETEADIKETLTAIKKMLLHDVKFSVDIFLYLIRSTSGVGAAAFDTLSKSRFEYEYGNYPNQQVQQQPQQKGFFGFMR